MIKCYEMEQFVFKIDDYISRLNYSVSHESLSFFEATAVDNAESIIMQIFLNG